MPQLGEQLPDYSPLIGLSPSFWQSNEASTSQVYEKPLRLMCGEIYRSAYWLTKARFAEARQRLKTTVTLECGWDTYGTEAPNDVARHLAGTILDALEADGLPPTRLLPSSEGGIAISFVEGDRRAEIEIYNSGEVAAATYSANSEPVVWELCNLDSALKNSITEIRVHLAA